jgi:hypothetical protein
MSGTSSPQPVEYGTRVAQKPLVNSEEKGEQAGESKVGKARGIFRSKTTH